MFAARGFMIVSRLRNERCGSVGCRIDIASFKRVCVAYSHPSHLFYRLPVVLFITKEIDLSSIASVTCPAFDSDTLSSFLSSKLGTHL